MLFPSVTIISFIYSFKSCNFDFLYEIGQMGEQMIVLPRIRDSKKAESAYV